MAADWINAIGRAHKGVEFTALSICSFGTERISSSIVLEFGMYVLVFWGDAPFLNLRKWFEELLSIDSILNSSCTYFNAA